MSLFLKMYSEDEMLMLSGIQHYVFCPRQWALIHIEQVWADNRLTVEGQLLHERADNPFYRQKNGACVSLRSVAISSRQLGLYGFTDVVELQPSEVADNCIKHPSYPGFWKPYPVEYKHGHAKPDERDEVQLAAQAICLEELYQIRIERGYLFYGETRRREEVLIDERLRLFTQRCADEMHSLYKAKTVPRAMKSGKCSNCSLFDICIPCSKKTISVTNYLKNNLYEEAT